MGKNGKRHSNRAPVAAFSRSRATRRAQDQKSQPGFVVRLKHRKRGTHEYLAGDGNFSFADLTPLRREAWTFPNPARASTATLVALGMRVRDFVVEIIPAGS